MRVPSLQQEVVTEYELNHRIDGSVLTPYETSSFPLQLVTFLPPRRYTGGTYDAARGLYIGGTPNAADHQMTAKMQWWSLDTANIQYNGEVMWLNNVTATYPSALDYPVLFIRALSIAREDIGPGSKELPLGVFTPLWPIRVRITINTYDGYIEVPDSFSGTFGQLDDGSGIILKSPSVVLDFPDTGMSKGGGVRGAKWAGFEENIFNVSSEHNK